MKPHPSLSQSLQKLTTPLGHAFQNLSRRDQIALLILAKSLDKLFDSVSLGGLNKFMGGVFGALKYALIISVIINVFDVIDSKFSIVNPETKTSSIVYNPMLKLAPKLWDEAKAISDKNNETENIQ